MLKSFGITRAFSDRYGAEWVRNAFARHGIELLKSPLTRSEIYANFAPMLNAGKVRLLDNQRLRSQLLALERRTIRGTGRDVIDHPTGGADDLANACCGALVMTDRAASIAPIGAVAVPIGSSTDWIPTNRDSLGFIPGEF